MSNDRIILNINPQTNVRSTQGAKKLYIPEECPRNCGLPRQSQKQPKVLIATMQETHPDLWEAIGGDNWRPRKKRTHIRYGCPHSMNYENMMFKRRLFRYYEYKKKVRELAAQQNLVLPPFGWALYFYIPIPTAWPKWKRKMMAGQIKVNTPDLDNYEKGFFDAMFGQDKFIGQLSGHGKFWIETEILRDEKGRKRAAPGHIEILLNQKIYNPFNVKLIEHDKPAFPHNIISK